MSRASFGGLHHHGNGDWIDSHIRFRINPIKAILGVLVLGLVIIYSLYLLSMIACSILVSLGIVESGFCSLIIG